MQSTACRFLVHEVSADKAYSSRANLELVERKGATPYIPVRANTVADRWSDDTWYRLYFFYVRQREAFLQHYHRRSHVESTMWMVKAKFGDALRSKTDVGQMNELLCKVLCHNICVLIQSMYELGIEPQF